MAGKRRFGRVRQLPSGRWQARYRGPDDIDRPAPRTFESKTSAERWLSVTEAEILQGDWIDPDAGTVLVADYGTAWIEERPGLRPKTISLYRYLLRAHIAPHFKAVKGADREDSPERPVLTVAQVYALADTVGPRYRALVLLATFASLRWAELAALRKEDIDLKTCTVRVTRQLVYLPGGGHSFAPPRSRAGVRVVAFPDLIVPDLQQPARNDDANGPRQHSGRIDLSAFDN